MDQMDANKKKTILDVRTRGEYNLGHIEGAVNIPVDEVSDRLDEIRQMPAPLVAYCRSGNRSGMAVKILQDHGIMDVINGGSMEQMNQLS